MRHIELDVRGWGEAYAPGDALAVCGEEKRRDEKRWDRMGWEGMG